MTAWKKFMKISHRKSTVISATFKMCYEPIHSASCYSTCLNQIKCTYLRYTLYVPYTLALSTQEVNKKIVRNKKGTFTGVAWTHANALLFHSALVLKIPYHGTIIFRLISKSSSDRILSANDFEILQFHYSYVLFWLISWVL